MRFLIALPSPFSFKIQKGKVLHKFIIER
jgi:hypothetical protein